MGEGRWVRAVASVLGNVSQRNHLVSVGCGEAAPYLAKLLNAADWGLMQRGTRDVCSCSAMNLWISSGMWEVVVLRDSYEYAVKFI